MIDEKQRTRGISTIIRKRNSAPPKALKFWSPWQFAIYLMIVLVCNWAEVYNNINVQIIVQSISNIIPSIHSLSVIAPNQAKAAFELSLAWIFSLAAPILFLPTIDWDFLEQRHKKLGGAFVASLVFALCGSIILAMFIYPITPSASRRGMLISMWFKLDMAYVWGGAILLMVGFGWSCVAGSVVVLYRKLFKGSMNK